MATPTRRIEELFLRIFKVTVLLIMSLALVSILLLIVTAAYQYSQTPKEPAPAQKAPVKEIGLEDLRKFLIEKEKRDSTKEDPTRQQPTGRTTSLRFQEEATALFRCTGEFGKKVGAEIEDASDLVNAQRLQQLRSYIERVADASTLRGDAWVKAMVAFTCMALADNSIIELKREQKVNAVFYPVIEFHIGAWDAIQSEKQKFEQREEERFASERSAEALRVAQAHAVAIGCLTATAGAFGLFMLLALYLLAAKAENDLRDINESVRSLRPASAE